MEKKSETRVIIEKAVIIGCMLMVIKWSIKGIINVARSDAYDNEDQA